MDRLDRSKIQEERKRLRKSGIMEYRTMDTRKKFNDVYASRVSTAYGTPDKSGEKD